MENDVKSAAPTPKGAFVSSLVRTNKEIKADRAADIADEAEMTYRRSIENMEMQLKKMKKQREGLLDLSPSNKMMIISANEFDAEKFVQEDQNLGLQIRNLKIKIDIYKERYEYLFGDPDESSKPSGPSPEDTGTVEA